MADITMYKAELKKNILRLQKKNSIILFSILYYRLTTGGLQTNKIYLYIFQTYCICSKISLAQHNYKIL